MHIAVKSCLGIRNIRAVYEGIRGGGWVVNIETTGKNRVFRSLAEGEDADRSARSLEELVCALGYQHQWERAQNQ